MPVKKSLKKVEIADGSIVNLKERDKVKTGFGFQVRHIDGTERFDGAERGDGKDRAFSDADEILSTESSISDTLLDRNFCTPKYDPEALNKRMETFAEKLEQAVIKVSPSEGAVPANVAAGPKDLIRVKFEKFVQLVASKDFLSVLEKNKNEDIVLSSNLLTELASAVEEKGEKKSPVIFLVGLAIGVIVTYLLIK